MMPFQVLDGVQDFRMFPCMVGPVFVSRKFVHIPQCTCEESAYPVVHRNIDYFSVLVGGRYSDSIASFGCFQKIFQLYFGIVHVLADDVCLRCALHCKCRQCQN